MPGIENPLAALPTAATHWLAADQLAAAYPAIDVDPRVLHVDNGHGNRRVPGPQAAAG